MTDPIVVFECDGFPFVVRTGERGEWDRGIIQEVQADYFWPELRAINPKRVVDVGAHIGAFAVTAAQRLGATVVAIEPDEQNYSLLIDNASLCARVMAVYGALAYSAGGLQLRRDPVNTGHHIVDVVEGEGDPYLMRRTLADVMEWNGWDGIDLLKLDCEGCEVDVFERADLSPVRAMVGEYHMTANQFAEIAARRLGDYIMQTRALTDTQGLFLAIRRGESWR